MADENKNYLERSDEELIRQGPPTQAPAPDPEPVTPDSVVPGSTDEVDDTPEPITPPASDEPDDDSNNGEDGSQLPGPQGDAAGVDAVGKVGGADVFPGGDSKAGDQKPVAPEPKKVISPTPAPAGEPDYAAVGKMVLGEIKANGKTLKLQSGEEVVKMVQMGTNYTKKLQELQPALRMIKMLENNDLLDETKLSYLIDLSQKNPLAIQKLLADSKFEPLSVDAEEAGRYTPGNHQVTDLEMRFQSAVDETVETEEGTQLLKEIHGQWDKESKQALYTDPSILTALNQQRSNGIYLTITSEVDRLRALGEIPVGTPFLQAYRGVGDMLQAQGRFAKPAGNPDPATPPVETRTIVPANNKASTNDEQVRAAAAPRGASKTVAPTKPNYLADSDEEFLKKYKDL